MNRIAGYLLPLLALALAALAFQELRFIGFPDGALTDWDPFRKIVLWAFITISLLAIPWFGYVGWSARRNPTPARLHFWGAVYLALAALLLVADAYLRYGSGRGG